MVDTKQKQKQKNKQKQTVSSQSAAPVSSTFPIMDSLKNTTKHMFQKVSPYERLMCNEGSSDQVKTAKERRRSIRHAAAKSKSGMWGPSHSFDSEDNADSDPFSHEDNDNTHADTLNKTTGEGSGGEGTNTTHEESDAWSHEDDEGEKNTSSTSLSRKKQRTQCKSPVSASSKSNKNTNPTISFHKKNHRRSKSDVDNKRTCFSTKTRQTALNETSETFDTYESQQQQQQQQQTENAHFPLSPFECSGTSQSDGVFVGIWNSASAVLNELFAGDCNAACNQCQGHERFHKETSTNYDNRQAKSVSNRISKKKLKKGSFNIAVVTKGVGGVSGAEAGTASDILGISRLSPPSKEISLERQRSNASSLTDGYSNFQHKDLNTQEVGDENAIAAARSMARETSMVSFTNAPLAPLASMGKNVESPDMKKTNKNQSPPISTLSLNSSVPFQRCISELTMKSSYGEAVTPVSDMRRMAYYAVGKHHVQKGNNGAPTGGNRRCYFTGAPIIGGRPFYAGSVQQGMRTLIVFCLPSALGLPKREDLEKVTEMEMNSQHDRKGSSDLTRRTMTGLSTAALSQHDSTFNEDGFIMSELFHSTAWTEDENGNLCESLNTDFIIQALPDPNRELLSSMQEIFPEQFSSLSQHLRRPHCWRLYVKFCFFSGLPIADGEMYYKVMDDIVEKNGKKDRRLEEISLSHEVMEAANGESAEILMLPGKKTFKYLQKHYKQQCAKLTPQKLHKKVFDRSSWIRVMPEV